MTDHAELLPTLAEAVTHVLDGLEKRRPGAWWTAGEVHKVLTKFDLTAVRRELRAQADAGTIETRVSGTEERPLREYRGKA